MWTANFGGGNRGAKVRDHAYKVTDADVESLKASGLSDDVIFEQTVGAAVRQGLRRLDRAHEVIT